MNKLLPLQTKEDIPKEYKNTPIEDLILYHNFNTPHKKYTQAELLIGMCMDNRKMLHIPQNFAFILRTGGANLKYSEFKISFAIAIGGIQYMALIGHTNCGMVGLSDKKEQFIKGLCKNAGWTVQAAEAHFSENMPLFEIGDAAEFTASEVKRLSSKYPEVKIVPFLYKVEDNKLYWIEAVA